jgi:hypothetical protein
LTKLFEFVVHVEAFSACWSWLLSDSILFLNGQKSARVGGTDHRWIWQKIQMTEEDPIPLSIPLTHPIFCANYIFCANPTHSSNLLRKLHLLRKLLYSTIDRSASIGSVDPTHHVKT